MKTKQNILLLFLAGLLSLSSCTSDDSVSGNTNPINGVRIKTMTQQDYIGGVWKDTYKTTNTFEGSNLMMSLTLTQKWNNLTSQWVNDRRALYTLYDNNHASEQVNQSWEVTNTLWTNQTRNTYTDDSSGNRLKTESDSWSLGVWQKSQKAEFIYDSNNYLIRAENTIWNTATSSYNSDPYAKLVYTNNNQGKPVLSEYYSGNNTSPYFKETITYDTNGFLLTRTGQLYSSDSNSWYVNYSIAQTNLTNGHAAMIEQTIYAENGDVNQKLRLLYEYY